MRRLKDKFKNYLIEIAKIKTTPHEIALGFAIGTFISILPTPGLNLAIAFLIIFLYKKISKISLLGSIFFWNPFTLTPIYILSFKIGNFILGSSPVEKFKIILLNNAYNFTKRYLVGNFILAASISLITYVFIYFIAKMYKSGKD